MRWAGCAAIVLALIGCGRSNVPQKPWIVAVSGDLGGRIVPCGCTTSQWGGLPRRAAWLEKARADADVIAADVGGAPGGHSEYDRLKFEAILRGETAMGIAAHNLGAAELALGPKVLRKLNAPWVSANAVAADGQPLAPPLRVVESAGRRLALVGVVSPRYATEEIRVEAPRDAVLAELKSAGPFDAVVVLAYAPEAELRELAAALPEVDAIVGGPTGQPIRPESIGPVLLTSATNFGKFLARLESPSGPNGRWTGQIVQLDEQWPDDPTQLKILAEMRKRLADEDWPADRTGFVKQTALPGGERVAGSAACKKCHEEEWKVWAGSRHAKAWHSLVEKGAQVDPECQRCHTTGYGLAGGFISAKRSGERIDVGCESCHGASARHAAEDKIRTSQSGRARESCVACHDRENSPDFLFEPYWKKTRHGPAKSDEPN